MESDKIKVYKYCLVPMCTNTTKTAPKKLFFLVPRKADVRRKWCKIIKRDEIKNPKLSSTTPLYVCEDHFDVESDMENYVKYKLFGGLIKVRKGALPHKFECQKELNYEPVSSALKKRDNIRYSKKVLKSDNIPTIADSLEDVFVTSGEDKNLVDDPLRLDNNDQRSIMSKHHKAVEVRFKNVNNKATSVHQSISEKKNCEKEKKNISKQIETVTVYSSIESISTAIINEIYNPNKGGSRKANQIKDIEEDASTSHQIDPECSSTTYHCSLCLGEITRFRYRCLVCPKYELCGECEGRGGHHDDHYVLRVPMQRPTAEAEQVESAVRRALTSLPIWKTAFTGNAKTKKKARQRVTTEKKQFSRAKTKKTTKKSVNEPSDILVTRNENVDEPYETVDEPNETVDEPNETVDKSNETVDEPNKFVHYPFTIKTEDEDEPEVKMEVIVMEEMDPLEEEAASQNVYIQQATRGSKRRRNKVSTSILDCGAGSSKDISLRGKTKSEAVSKVAVSASKRKKRDDKTNNLN